MKNNIKSYFSYLLLFLVIGETTAQFNYVVVDSLLSSTPSLSYQDCAVDMNGDHLDDVVRVTDQGIFIDYQQADGSYNQRQFLLDFQNLPDWSICAGDIDGNGLNDLLFGGGGAVSFVYANMDGSSYFEEAVDEYVFSQRSTFADIDNDGNLDAFVCNDNDQNHPYRNDGLGNLIEDQNLIETIDLAGNYSAIWVDYDNDWDTDLYITKCKKNTISGDPRRTNAMYRNNGDGTYTEVAAEIGMDDNSQSWTTVFEDFDNDGDFDALIINHDFQNKFMINDGLGNYSDQITTTGIDPNDLGAFEGSAGDFNNDGYIDIFSGLQKQLYINNGDLTFTGHLFFINEGGIGDLNNDGFLDFVRNNQLFVNKTNDNNWLKINTVGTVGNKNGIGTRIEIYGEWGIQVREVRAGQSYSSMSSLTTHFGIGTATSIDSIILKWPSGIRTKLENPNINMTHLIPESECVLESSVIVVDGESEICMGDSLEIIAPPDFEKFLWSNGDTTQNIIVTTSGIYNVQLKDASGCTSLSNSVLISYKNEVKPNLFISGDLSFCAGDSVILNTDIQVDKLWSTSETTDSIVVTDSGVYYVQVEAVCSLDLITSDSITITVANPQTPIALNVTITEPGPLTLTALGDSLVWFASQDDNNVIGNGNSFEFDYLDQDSTIFVESQLVLHGQIQTGGKFDTLGGGGLSDQNGFCVFDAYQPFLLLGVTVYVPEDGETGIRDIQLLDIDDNIVDAVQILIGPGEHSVDLDFDIPQGSGYKLKCPQSNLFVNYSNAIYPYTIGDVGAIVSSSNGDNSFYYFYDWIVEKGRKKCISERVAVTASVIVSSTDIDQSPLIEISLYPNPVRNDLSVSFKSKLNRNIEILIYDVLGQLVWISNEITVRTEFSTELIEMSHLSEGIYRVIVRDNNSWIGQNKIIKL